MICPVATGASACIRYRQATNPLHSNGHDPIPMLCRGRREFAALRVLRLISLTTTPRLGILYEGDTLSRLAMIFVLLKRAVLVLVFSLWCALATTSAYGLETPNIPALLLPSSDELAPLASHAEVLCDADGDMSLTAAQTAVYTAMRNEMPTSGKCRGYWIRFDLQTTAVPAGGWVLQMSQPWSRADLYVVRDGVVSVARSGLDVPPQTQPLASGGVVIPLSVEPGAPQVFYLHAVGDTTRFGAARSIGGTIYRLDAWVLQQRSTLFGQGGYAGIILGLALYNLILYLAIRERVYLYYVLYVISFGSLWIARTGFFHQYLWPRHVWWNNEFQPYLAASAIVFSVLFVRQFLSTRTQSRWVDWVLRAIALLTALLCLARAVGTRVPLALPLVLIGLAISIIYFVLGLFALLRGYRPARFFLLAWSALLIGNVVYIFMFLRILPNTFLTYHSAQAGSAMECILLAFALADRVNLLKRAREERQMQYTRELQEQVDERTGELSSAVEKLKTASVTDPLTGLSNRRLVDSAIQPWLAELQRARIRNLPGVRRRYLAICLADLDHFKLVNDDLGHAVGDRVLQAAADTLRQNVRATAILARWGGEEFLILDHVTETEEDLLMAERLRRSIIDECPPEILETGRPLSLSLGVVRYPFCENYPDLLGWDHCLALADHALYRAKKAGRNRWQCYRPNESALRDTIRDRGAEEVRRLLRLHADEAFALGLIEVVEHVPSDVGVL